MSTTPNTIPFLRLGFRPFFFTAGLASVCLMLLWWWIYQYNLTFILRSDIPMITWHAHEMIFAYVMVVIAGFLLTAIKNWTGEQTIYGKSLLVLLLLWIPPRILPFTNVPLIYLALVDVSFLIGLSVAISLPIIKAKSWRHIGVVSKVGLMAVGHILFYLGLLGVVDQGVLWGLYFTFYLILSLIFVIARRVFPFFLEKALAGQLTVKNYVWVDRASLVLFTAYSILEVFFVGQQLISFVLAIGLFCLHSLRLYCWYHHQIWRMPLLWSLYLAYGLLIVGFALKILAFFFAISPYLIIHAFAFGMGLMSLSMMSRVILGHTARDVYQSPKQLGVMFLLLLLAFIFRVLVPVFEMTHYTIWIGCSQILWILAFAGFVFLYAPMLWQQRLDGKFG